MSDDLTRRFATEAERQRAADRAEVAHRVNLMELMVAGTARVIQRAMTETAATNITRNLLVEVDPDGAQTYDVLVQLGVNRMARILGQD